MCGRISECSQPTGIARIRRWLEVLLDCVLPPSFRELELLAGAFNAHRALRERGPGCSYGSRSKLDHMAHRVDSISLLTAGGDEGRRSAAALAASVDTTSEFGVQLRKVLDDLANGEDIVIVRRDREVSPAGAAELLGVSRQFVDRLLADGVLAFRRLPGSNHRRIRIADVLALSEDRERIGRGRIALGALLG